MSKFVFILGAGCSQDSNVPTMDHFLERAEDLERSGQAGVFQHDFTMALRARRQLAATHSKSSSIDIHNLEAVFSAFEMGALIKKLGDFSQEDLARFPDMYRAVIGITIERTQKFQWSDKRLKAPSSYQSMSKLLSGLLQSNQTVSVITFNYDIGLDYALNFDSVPYDYCLAPIGNQNVVKLLKLHGSINWGTVDGQNIHPWNLNQFFRQWNPGHLGEPNNSIAVPICSNLHQFYPSGLPTKACRRYPVVVPPTWNKSDYHRLLTNVWSSAAKELEDAEHIFVIGYSMPPTDQFFHTLFALGSQSETVVRRFWVFNPDPTVGKKFENSLGTQIVPRKFEFSTDVYGMFHTAIDRISSYIREPI